MSGRFLLDSNIVIAFLAGDDSVHNRLAQADELFTPSIVMGELYFGVLKSGRVEENLGRLRRFERACVVLGCDPGTAWEYAGIKNGLRSKGRPIPENDIWIAATARQHGLTLVTRDQHFSAVDGLKCDAWLP